MYFICYGIRRIADSNCRFESQIRIADSNFRFDQIGTFGLDFQSCIIIFAMPKGSRHTWVIPRTPTPKYESTTLEMLALPMRVCAGQVKVVLCSLRTSSFGGFFQAEQMSISARNYAALLIRGFVVQNSRRSLLKCSKITCVLNTTGLF